MTMMIDNEGYRTNVGMIIADAKGRVLWARRFGQNAWQFPQGGVQPGETPEQAMYRELREEVGLVDTQVQVLGSSKGWLRYRLPRRFIRHDAMPVCIGQKQKWFLLRLLVDEKNIRFDGGEHPEFDGWQWVTYWYPLQQVIAFKREVYRIALKELFPALASHVTSRPFITALEEPVHKRKPRPRK